MDSGPATSRPASGRLSRRPDPVSPCAACPPARDPLRAARGAGPPAAGWVLRQPTSTRRWSVARAPPLPAPPPLGASLRFAAALRHHTLDLAGRRVVPWLTCGRRPRASIPFATPGPAGCWPSPRLWAPPPPPQAPSRHLARLTNPPAPYLLPPLCPLPSPPPSPAHSPHHPLTGGDLREAGVGADLWRGGGRGKGGAGGGRVAQRRRQKQATHAARAGRQVWEGAALGLLGQTGWQHGGGLRRGTAGRLLRDSAGASKRPAALRVALGLARQAGQVPRGAPLGHGQARS
jgi:hypothetical protein